MRAVMALEQRNDVISAEPNYIYDVELPVITQENIPQNNNYNWAATKIQLEEAWEIETGSESIRVDILDSGIDVTHPEISGKVRTVLSWSAPEWRYAFIVKNFCIKGGIT